MKKNKKIRYGVVGLGHIAQTAILPALRHSKNSELTALISGDNTKLDELSQKYKVENCFGYEDFERCLEKGLVDAVFIALPNIFHREYTEMAAEKGVHVLCEKPMATSVSDCNAMIKSAEKYNTKLMVAYRLHFDPANLKTIQIAGSGNLGDVRLFNSVFTMQVTDTENIRLKENMGGGTLYDIGIYCINAARYIFRDEPMKVSAVAMAGKDKRFSEVFEMVSATMQFPKGRLATFTCSFGAHEEGYYEVVGTHGSICLENAFDYVQPMKITTSIQDKQKQYTFPKHDQFAAELDYFSECIIRDKKPEPSGLEGKRDVAIIEALYKSVALERPIFMEQPRSWHYAKPSQAIMKPPLKRAPREIHSRGPK